MTTPRAGILLFECAEILLRELDRRPAALECCSELIKLNLDEPSRQRLQALLTAANSPLLLLKLFHTDFDRSTTDAQRVGHLIGAARVQLDELDNPDGAAADLHELLQIQPDHLEALDLYAECFHRKKNLKKLTELVSYRCHLLKKKDPSANELLTSLQKLADLQETHLGDARSAQRTWQQIAEHPSSTACDAQVHRLQTVIDES